MKKSMIALLGGLAVVGVLAGGYCLMQGNLAFGILFCAVAVVMAITLFANMNREEEEYVQESGESSAGERVPTTRSSAPAVNLAFYSDLSRLIDEGKDISGYLRGCGAPKNIVKRVNPGGTTAWYYHKEGLGFDEFSADFPHGEVPRFTHPNIKEQRIEPYGASDVHILKLDLYRALWDWGEIHPEQRRYTNSMRMAFHGAYKPNDDDDNSFLNKSIDEVKAQRKANKKKPKKKRSYK